MKISVITAVYDRADSIAQAVQSVQTQTWPDVEHVVIDGASTDGTLQAVQAIHTVALSNHGVQALGDYLSDKSSASLWCI